MQQSLNRDRDRLGLTRVQPLENAPPVLAFTTVALGGFRGLISNALWMRASDLQDEDKFFEMAQLADWITKLEPHFVQVWLVQAWNMAYNISVKFKESSPGQFPDRWRWVKAGIELLRDDGLRYNPNETLIYRELAWFFQHKIGQNLDDASMYYKQQWANDMAKVFGKKKPNLEELIHPQTADQKERARLLRETYKMDPQFMKEVDERYGPLEWRLPEAHAIYWAALGLKKASENPDEGQGGRLDHPAPRDLSIHAAELPARAAGDESLCPGLRVRAQPGHHPQGELRLRAGGRGGREESRPHPAGPPELPARRRLFPLRIQPPGRRGAVV